MQLAKQKLQYIFNLISIKFENWSSSIHTLGGTQDKFLKFTKNNKLWRFNAVKVKKKIKRE